MKINTKYFGEMNIADEERINFPEPLPGFDKIADYVIVQFYEDSDSLLCLQSIDEPNIAFVLVNPHYIVENYSPSVSAEDMKALGASGETPLAYYAIAVVSEEWQDSTVNLKCPIAVNPEKMLGRQLIMEDASYSMRHPMGKNGQKEAEPC